MITFCEGEISKNIPHSTRILPDSTTACTVTIVTVAQLSVESGIETRFYVEFVLYLYLYLFLFLFYTESERESNNNEKRDSDHPGAPAGSRFCIDP